MPYIKIPKDLSKIETKIIFNLTKRQLICFSLAGIVGIPIYFLSRKYFGNSVGIAVMTLIVMPFFILAMYQRNGQYLEMILKNFIKFRYLRDGKREYKRKRSKSTKKKNSIFDLIKSPPPITSQETIYYKSMYNDGICQVTGDYFSKAIEFSDTNYHLESDEKKSEIFDNYCSFINYFDNTVSVQFSFNKSKAREIENDSKDYSTASKDVRSHLKSEYNEYIDNKRKYSNKEYVKKYYITFGVNAKNINLARQRLDIIQKDIISNFKKLGVRCKVLNSYERMKLLFNSFRDEAKEDDVFSYSSKHAKECNLTTKDYIAPMLFDFSKSKHYKSDSSFGAVSILHIYASELHDTMIKELLELDSSISINIHIKSISQAEAIKLVKRKISDLDKMRIEEQKKAVRSGYDMDIIPSDLYTFGMDAKEFLKLLQEENERMFNVTILIRNNADSKQKLDNFLLSVSGITQKYNCIVKPLEFCQEDGLMSTVPLGINLIDIRRLMTTSSVSILIPFTSKEIISKSENAVYYGQNTVTNNIIYADRKQLKNPNGLILGTPGSGKSFIAKREITSVNLYTDDDIIICDPEAEYINLTKCLGGQVIKISPNSKTYINPLDINLNYNDEDNPLLLKTDFILSFFEIIAGGKFGLEPIEKSILDKAVRNIYKPYIENNDKSNIPILEDLYNKLNLMNTEESKRLSSALELYVHGSLNVFNHHTNIDITGKIVCFDTKELGTQLKKVGMLIIQDYVWNKLTLNRAEGKTTRYYIDEFHLLLKDEQTALYSVEIWKRFRKWGGIPTGITQNVKDLLRSKEIENIFDNSDFICMLNQASGDKEILQKHLRFSDRQAEFITGANQGEGLIVYGDTILPFYDKFPKDSVLYKLMTTKPDEALV